MDKSPLEEYLCCRRGRRVLKGSGWCTETPLRRARVRPTTQARLSVEDVMYLSIHSNTPTMSLERPSKRQKKHADILRITHSLSREFDPPLLLAPGISPGRLPVPLAPARGHHAHTALRRLLPPPPSYPTAPPTRLSTPLTWLALSPSHRYVLAASMQGFIALLPTTTTTPVPDRSQLPVSRVRVRAHTSAVHAVQWYPTDDSLFVSAGSDGAVRLFDASTLSEAFATTTTAYGMTSNTMWCVDIRDGGLIVSGSEDGRTILVDPRVGIVMHMGLDLGTRSTTHRTATTTTTTTATTSSGCDILAVAWLPATAHPDLVAAGGRDGRIRVFDVRRGGNADPLTLSFGREGASEGASAWEGVPERRAHNGPVVSLVAGVGGSDLLSVGRDGMARGWDAIQGRCLGQVGCHGGWGGEGGVERGLTETATTVAAVATPTPTSVLRTTSTQTSVAVRPKQLGYSHAHRALFVPSGRGVRVVGEVPGWRDGWGFGGWGKQERGLGSLPSLETRWRWRRGRATDVDDEVRTKVEVGQQVRGCVWDDGRACLWVAHEGGGDIRRFVLHPRPQVDESDA